MDALKKSNLRTVIFAIVGKKGLALDEDERRAIQVQVTGKSSLSDMSALDMEDLISHLRRVQAARQRGVAPANPWGFVFQMPADRQRMAKKVYRLAEKIGTLQNPPVGPMSKEYIEGIRRQMKGTDQPLEFCSAEELHQVVQALEVHVARLQKAGR